MKVIGNPEESSKFYIQKEDGSVSWVSSFSTAKSYANDPLVQNWFNKTIYCTNEDILKGYDGKLYLRSQLPEKPKELLQVETLKNFKRESSKVINKKLEEFAQAREFDTFYELISWYNSSVKAMKKQASDGLKYRDKLHTYTQGFIDEINTNFKETLDISHIYTDYLERFPEF
jgi:hypothetical protein